MNINYQISASDKTEDFVAKVYEAVSPNAEVGSISVPAPHTAPFSVSFTGLDLVTHVVRLIGVTTGTVWHKYTVQPTANIVTIFDDIKFKIGDGKLNTPTAGEDTYQNDILKGFTTDQFNIYRNGYGFLFPDIHFSFDSEAGVITLLNGDQFGDEEEFLIAMKPQAITNAVNDSVVGKQFGGNGTETEIYIDVNTTVNYDPSHLRHIIRLAGASANYVFPTGAAIPIGYIFRVTNFGAYADPSDKGKITFDNAPLLWGNTTKTELDIQFTGTYEFEFDGANWNCTMYNVPQETPGATIVYAQSVILGLMTHTDQLFTVTIPYQGALPNFRVIGNLVSLNDWNQDNDVSFVIANKTSTSFDIGIKRYASTSKNLGFDFIIVK